MRLQRPVTIFFAAMLLALGVSRANRPASAGGDAIVYLPVVLNTAGPGVWVTILEDDFEGSFPEPIWALHETGAGDYQWAQRACVAHSGTYSLWGIGGGEDGGDLTCGANYPSNAQAWMVAGPFDLSHATAAALDYQARIFTESLLDGVIACPSPDNAAFNGCVLLSGDSHGDWISAAGVSGGELYRSMFDSVLGDDSVWLGLIFESNGSLIHPNGAFVDDLVLRKCTGGECPPASAAGAQPAGDAQVSAVASSPFSYVLMDQRLTHTERAILTAVRPDLAPVWDLAWAGRQDELTPKQQAELLLGQSILYERQGQFTVALKVAQQAIDLAEAAGWADVAAGGYACQSSYYYDLGSYDLSQKVSWEVLERDPNGVPGVTGWNTLGVCAAQGAEMDIEKAAGYFHQAAELSRALDHRFGYAMALNWRGQHVHQVRGELDLMLACCDEAARIMSQLEFPYSGHYYVRAYYYWLRGERDKLNGLLGQLRAVIPNSSFAAASHAHYTALLALDEEDYPTAAQALAQLRDLASTTGHLECECWVRLATSRFQLLTGDPQSAITWARDAVQTARRKESRFYELAGHLACARAALALGDGPLCREYLSTAETIADRLGCQLELAELHLLRAVLDAREQRAEAGAAWLEAARRIKLGGYGFILERERALAFPLVAAYARSAGRALRASAETMLDQLAKIPPLPLHVAGLGRFEVRQGRRRTGERAWQKRRAGELFRFLLLQPGHGARREVIFEALCPGQPPESAQTFLHHATSSLRRLLEPDLPDKFPSRYVFVEDDQVALRLPSGSSVDFADFERQLRPLLVAPADLPNGGPPPGAAELAPVLALYSGDLFPPDRHADWAVDASERLAELHRRGLLALAQLYLAGGQPQAALDTCRAILVADPWREEAVLMGMQACLALNDRPSALRLYRRLEQALLADLQIAPRADLLALAASLQNT